MNLRDWKTSFLGNRGLAAPSGKPLFTYRMTKEEFQDLEQNLRDYLEDKLGFCTLGEVARDNPIFSAAFVFYGAEWWKRRFSGHQWSWTPILQDLGADPDDWGQSRRSACVEEGFHLWNIDLSFSTGFHYLANIAFHGGLPLQLIAAARGGIGHILSRVMRTATGAEETATLMEWIDSISSPLPQAYRKDEIYWLLASIAKDIIDLKNVAGLTQSEGAVAKLDREVPGWRERLPIALDDSQTSGLIDQLVSEVAAERHPQAAGSGLRAERRVEMVEEGIWRLSSTLDVDSFIEAEQLRRQFALGDSGLEQMMTLMIRRGVSDTCIGIRRLVGQDRYRLERRDAGCIGADAAGDHSLVLSARSGKSFHSPLVRGAALEDDAPWVFTIGSPEAQDGSFLKQRNGKIPTQSALLCLPPDWKIGMSDEGAAKEVGKLVPFGRTVWIIKGTASFIDSAGQAGAFSCGHLEDEYSYDFAGQRVWDCFSSQVPAFSGIPKLEKTDLDSGTVSRLPVTQWRYRGTAWKPSADGLYGPAQGQYGNHDEIMWQGKAILLPEGFRIDLAGGEDARSGIIIIKNSGFASLVLSSEGVKNRIESRDGAIVVEVTADEGLDPPELVEFKATWPRNPDAAALRLPFPSRGVTIHTADNNRLLSGSSVTLRELVGMRVIVFSPSDCRGFIQIHGQGESARTCGRGAKRELVFNQSVRRIEIRMVDFVADIRRMLSLANSLDALVEVEISIPGCASESFHVSHFNSRLKADEEAGKVYLESHSPGDGIKPVPESPCVSAIRLNSTGSDPFPLDPDAEGDDRPLSWTFPAERLDPGPWLVFPSRDSPCDFRPVLWPIETSNIKDLVASKGSLPKAIATIDESLRMLELSDALEMMVRDPDDPGWRLTEWLAGQTPHLHLSALDLWRSFARSGPAMAMLAFRATSLSSDFVSRFPDELSFLWELVPLASWIKALQYFMQQAKQLSDSVREMAIQNHIDGRTEIICFGNPGMLSILRLAKAFSDGNVDPHDKHMEIREIASTYRDLLFSGPECEYQKLLRRHMNDEWPASLFDNELRTLTDSGYKGLLHSDPMAFRRNVVNAPAILAVYISGLADLGWKIEPELVSRLRAIRDFDPEWFNVALSKNIIRCLATRDSLDDLVSLETN